VFLTYTSSGLLSKRNADYAERRVKIAFMFCAIALRSLAKDIDSGVIVSRT